MGLGNGTAYRIRVRAVNGAGNAPWAFVSATPQETATPTAQWERSSVTVTETDKDRFLRLRIILSEALTGAATLTVSQADASAADAAGSADWSKVTDDCAEGASGDTSMACAIVIKGDNLLESTETLKLSMSAGSGSIAVGARSTITVTIEDDDAPPLPPTGLTVASRGTRLDLSWMHPHRLPRRYEVHYTSSSTVAGDAAAQTGATPSAANGWVDSGHTGISSRRSLTGLTNDVEYRVRVRSVSDNGESAWVTGKGTPALQPVRDLVFEPLNTGLKVSWTAPVDGTPTGFDVHYTSAPATGAGSVADGAAVQTVSAAAGWLAVARSGVVGTQEIGSLVNGRRYRVRVRAVYSAGSSAWVTGAGAPKLTVVSFVRNAAATPPEFTNTLKFRRTEGQHSTIPLTLKMEPPLLAHSTMNLRAGAGGTAVAGEDYSGLPGTSVSLGAGAATASFSLTLLNDDIAEAFESLFVELQAVNNAPYTLGADRQAEVVIADDDVVTVSFRKTSYRVSEGDRLPVEVVIDKEATFPITVTAEANADTDTDTADATPGADYRLENPTVTIPAGSRSAPVPPAVTAVVDGAAEDDEVLVMTLDNASHAAGGRVEVGPDALTVTIADDRPSVSLSAAPNPVAEGSAVTVTATLTAALHSDAAIPVALTRGTAEAGDYGALTSITVPARADLGHGRDIDGGGRRFGRRDADGGAGLGEAAGVGDAGQPEPGRDRDRRGHGGHGARRAHGPQRDAGQREAAPVLDRAVEHGDGLRRALHLGAFFGPGIGDQRRGRLGRERRDRLGGRKPHRHGGLARDRQPDQRHRLPGAGARGQRHGQLGLGVRHGHAHGHAGDGGVQRRVRRCHSQYRGARALSYPLENQLRPDHRHHRGADLLGRSHGRHRGQLRARRGLLAPSGVRDDPGRADH